jgi:O-antigen/teichoic acid export membrane protein
MRLANTLRNLVWNFIMQLILIITGLLLKKILLDTIGTEKVGLNYVFNDITCLLSIADLGLTGIIAYHLYEPLVRKDELQIIKIMRFFQKTYAVIGCIVIALGLAIMPFLGLVIGDTTIDNKNKSLKLFKVGLVTKKRGGKIKISLKGFKDDTTA